MYNTDTWSYIIHSIFLVVHYLRSFYVNPLKRLHFLLEAFEAASLLNLSFNLDFDSHDLVGF